MLIALNVASSGWSLIIEKGVSNAAQQWERHGLTGMHHLIDFISAWDTASLKKRCRSSSFVMDSVEKYTGIVTRGISRLLLIESSTGAVAPKRYLFPHGPELRGPLLTPA